MKNLTDPETVHELLNRHHFRFSKSLGQNFLIDAGVPERIAESAGLNADCGVLEIGPGIGCLTVQLAGKAGKVLTVELDGALRPILEEILAEFPNAEVLYGDIMKQDLKTLAEEKLPQRTKLVCANLPYNITTPVLTRLIQAGCFERICIMIQKEVAERICAGPGNKDYGAFGLYVQWYYEPELLFSVSPHCFMPQPKVTSAVIRLTRREEPPFEVEQEEMLFRLIRAGFNQRRKTLVNAIHAAFPEKEKPELENLLQKLKIDPKIRAEMLNIGDFVRISNDFSAAGRGNL
ncbi:MAG: 16S rRNA (adenine(1518)-N(6)/adenine(1519)-N(6))-dimethyltransferase RsmA [Oscillospiraceae bacterium]|nr:16S rRNA (adenine(1518)-N(6)/adenine(1519)-N(6))-dimethyltransferase RsmA [Oscillospiraceae bacterium]